MKKSRFAFLNPKIKDHNTKNSVLLYTLLIILTLMFVLVTVILKATRDELRTVSAIQRSQGTQDLGKMIREAVDNLYQPAFLAPTEQKQYVYEMHLRFPSHNESDRILAGEGSSSGDGIEYATVTSRYLMATAKSELNTSTDTPDALLNSVPMFQKCSRPFLIQFTGDTSKNYPGEYTEAGIKKLASGKMLYVFRSNSCTSKYFADKYTKVEMDRLQAQLLQAESY